MSFTLVSSNDTVHEGDAAMHVLRQIQRPACAGLMFVHSFRQTQLDFALHARMIALVSRTSEAGAPSLLAGASLLVVNERPDARLSAQWLEPYKSVKGLSVRMLLWRNSSLPALPEGAKGQGYSCGELLALAQTAHIWGLFRWTLACSGPDALLTPIGSIQLERLLRLQGDSPSSGCSVHGTNRTRDPFLGNRFPAPQHHVRWSMDLFVFLTEYFLNDVWARTASMCLAADGRREAGGMPEAVLHDSFMRHRFNVRLINPESHKHANVLYSQKAKFYFEQPPRGFVVWHSHNRSNIASWLDANEHKPVDAQSSFRGG